MDKYSNLTLLSELKQEGYLSLIEFNQLKEDILSSSSKYVNEDYLNFKRICNLLFIGDITRDEFDNEKIKIFYNHNFNYNYLLSDEINYNFLDVISCINDIYEEYDPNIMNDLSVYKEEILPSYILNNLSLILPYKFYYTDKDEIINDIKFFERVNSTILVNYTKGFEKYNSNQDYESYNKEEVDNYIDWDPSDFDCGDGTITKDDYDSYNKRNNSNSEWDSEMDKEWKEEQEKEKMKYILIKSGLDDIFIKYFGKLYYDIILQQNSFSKELIHLYILNRFL